MRARFQSIVEKGRIKYGHYGTPKGVRFGGFQVGALRIMASEGEKGFVEWEHVSVSLESRCPTWDEMCLVKSWFWGPEETVLQFHPPESEWINNHPHCLHLWKPWAPVEIPLPPPIAVGLKEANPCANSR